MKKRFFVHPVNRKRRQKGVAAIGLAAMVLLGSAALLGTYVATRSVQQPVSVEDQIQTVLWARQAIANFAAVHGRLPCTSGSGKTEDCSRGGKGRLPMDTLLAFSGAPPASVRVRRDIYYMYYAGNGTAPADPNLGVVSEAFQPSLADASPAADYKPLASGLDLCAKIHTLGSSGSATPPRWMFGAAASSGPGDDKRAHIPHPDGSGSIFNVAYGLAVGTGSPGTDSGLNADMSSLAMESPSRLHDAKYQDLVAVADFNSLGRELRCDTALASLDTLAVGQSYIADAQAFRDGNMTLGDSMTKVAGPIVAGDALSVTAAVIDVKNALWDVVTAAARIVVFTSTLQWPRIPPQVASIGAAISGKALGMVDLARGAVGLSVDASYMTAYQKVQAEAEKNTSVWSGGPALLEAADKAGMNRALPTEGTAPSKEGSHE
ncbi:MAG: hypothetical protein Q7T87_05640 [Polaromonas sp.]|nr:hypothetical protein [Polaromonas sp.]